MLDLDCVVWSKLDIMFWDWPLVLLRGVDPRRDMIQVLDFFNEFFEEEPQCCLDAYFCRPLRERASLDDVYGWLFSLLKEMATNREVTVAGN